MGIRTKYFKGLYNGCERGNVCLDFPEIPEGPLHGMYIRISKKEGLEIIDCDTSSSHPYQIIGVDAV